MFKGYERSDVLTSELIILILANEIYTDIPKHSVHDIN